jgi:hypothetical protein
VGNERTDSVTLIISGIMALIILIYIMYAFVIVLLSFGILAVVGFVFQCSKAFFDGKLNAKSAVAFGVSSAFSAAAGEVVGPLLTSSLHDLLSGQIMSAIVAGICVVITYLIINRMTQEIES